MTYIKRCLLLLLALHMTGCANSRTVEVSRTEPDRVESTLAENQSIRETLATEATEQEETEIDFPELSDPVNTDFVPVQDYIPGIVTELKYATEDNFTGMAIYPFSDCYLRYGTVQKLRAVCEELGSLGLSLKIWDGFRPVYGQFALWEACPDPRYVADPSKGFGNHPRGNTVDVTLVDASGKELKMPTAFDDFSALADRDYSDCTAEAAENALLLQTVMEKHGFRGYQAEWWHFSDTDSYDVEMVFDPGSVMERYADCREYISLRKSPDVSAEVITKIPAGDTVILLGYTEGFALVDYQGRRGYALLEYLAPVT